VRAGDVPLGQRGARGYDPAGRRFDGAGAGARGGGAAPPHPLRGGIRLTRLLPGADRVDGLRLPGGRALARRHGTALENRRRCSDRRELQAERVPLPAGRLHLGHGQLQRHGDVAPAGVPVAPPHGELRRVRRGAFAWRLLGGTILPARRISFAGQSVRFVPPDQRFYGGGPNSVRGYARNELGPRVYFRTIQVDVSGDTTYGNLQASATGGNAIFVANVEFRFLTPLFPDRMRVAVFADVGQVWERDDPTVRGVRFTPGVGVRFVTPLGPVRLDAAYAG